MSNLIHEAIFGVSSSAVMEETSGVGEWIGRHVNLRPSGGAGDAQAIWSGRVDRRGL